MDSYEGQWGYYSLCTPSEKALVTGILLLVMVVIYFNSLLNISLFHVGGNFDFESNTESNSESNVIKIN